MILLTCNHETRTLRRLRHVTCLIAQKAARASFTHDTRRRLFIDPLAAAVKRLRLGYEFVRLASRLAAVYTAATAAASADDCLRRLSR